MPEPARETGTYGPFLDGRKTHGTRQAFETDRRRDQRLTAAGWTVIRTTWRQLKHRPHELRQTLLTLPA
jgi:very-short-patch-repair endonuclease